jgi:hypothetical protein
LEPETADQQPAREAGLPRAERSIVPGDSLNGLIEMLGVRQQQFIQQFGAERQKRVDRLQVVVFSDQNDLLSYPLRNSRQEQGAKYKSVDVIVSNV